MAPLFESVRCMLYFGFDYYIVINTPWNLSGVDKLVFDVMITALRLFHVASIAIWLIVFFTKTNNDKSKAMVNGKSSVVDDEKQSKEKEFGDNIELAKKLVSKQVSRGFNVANIVASITFLLAAGIITYVLYFVRIDSCNQLINSIKH